jgi:hypothetical protein
MVGLLESYQRFTQTWAQEANYGLSNAGASYPPQKYADQIPDAGLQMPDMIVAL